MDNGWSIHFVNNNVMLQNYFKIGWRSLKSRKAVAFINICGLAIGMAGALLILLWVRQEYSYDSFHANSKTLYKVWNRSAGTGDKHASLCWREMSGMRWMMKRVSS